MDKILELLKSLAMNDIGNYLYWTVDDYFETQKPEINICDKDGNIIAYLTMEFEEWKWLKEKYYAWYEENKEFLEKNKGNAND